MIFPPNLGQQAGTQAAVALLGFIITDAGLAVLGILAVVIAGNSMNDLIEKPEKDRNLFDRSDLSFAGASVCAPKNRFCFV